MLENIRQEIWLSRFTELDIGLLKGQVTFLKLCLLVVCLALIIPRFKLFWLTTVFRSKNAFICLCQHILFLPQTGLCWHSYRGDVFLVVITKRRTGSTCPFYLDITCLSRQKKIGISFPWWTCEILVVLIQIGTRETPKSWASWSLGRDSKVDWFSPISEHEKSSWS